MFAMSPKRFPSFLLMLTGAALAFGAITDPVRVETGLLSGAPGRDAEVRVYKGVPFAAPPVGNLRWRAPQPAGKWDGIRKAEQFGSSCTQGGGAGRGGKGGDKGVAGGEDCLYSTFGPRRNRPQTGGP